MKSRADSDVTNVERSTRVTLDRAASDAEHRPRARTVIVIGASNVTLALPMLWSGVRQNAHQPTRLIVVAGHGRSYGLPSTVWGRTLPSILQSECWAALERLVPKHEPLEAVITDVGNDILYGASAAVLGDWVQECVDRLLSWPVRLTMTELPMASLHRMSAARFQFFRSLLFPRSTLRYRDALDIGTAVNSVVRHIAATANARLIRPEADWYGIDPIHIRRTYARVAWSQLCPVIPDTTPLPPLGPLDCMALWRLKPALYWRGQQQHEHEQPAIDVETSQLWLY